MNKLIIGLYAPALILTRDGGGTTLYFKIDPEQVFDLVQSTKAQSFSNFFKKFIHP